MSWCGCVQMICWGRPK